MAEYIERERAYENMVSEMFGTGFLERATNAIKDVPTADVQEVNHAKFELVNNGKGVCSNCHRLDSIDELAKYCRYCGAKLD